MITFIGVVISIIGYFSILFISGLRLVGVILALVGAVIVSIGSEYSKLKATKAKVDNLMTHGCVGKDLKHIEKYLGPHTSVNISNDNNRIYIWDDYFEILCNKDNKCKEILKDSTKN